MITWDPANVRAKSFNPDIAFTGQLDIQLYVILEQQAFFQQALCGFFNLTHVSLVIRITLLDRTPRIRALLSI